MARKILLNCLQQLGTTAVSLTPSQTISATGNSQYFPEFGVADAVRFYLDITAAGTTLTLHLMERDPATGVFRNADPASDPVFGTAFTSNQAGLVSTIDPLYGDTYQIAWTVTGSFTLSLMAELVQRS